MTEFYLLQYTDNTCPMKKHAKNKKNFNFSSLKSFLQRGSGNIYVIAILGTIVAGSALMTGGLVPQLDPPPDDAVAVQIDTNIPPGEENNALELRSFGILTPSPTPTIEPTPIGGTATPTVPIPTGEVCINNTLFLALVDISQSMADDGKITQLQDALTELKDSMRPETALGIYGFGSYNFLSYGSTKGVKEILNFTKLKGPGEGRITTAINNLEPGGEGGTYMKNGFNVAANRLTSIASSDAYRGYRLVAIVFSDGIPEASSNDPEFNPDTTLDLPCAPERSTSGGGSYQKCWYNRQDPRRFGNSLVALQNAVKPSGGRVYSVVVYDNRRGSDDSYFISPVDSGDRLRSLIKQAASKESYYYNLDVGSVNQLASRFRSIIDGVCEEG